MPATFCKGLDVHQIIHTLPEEQMRHLSHVGQYVGIMADKIQAGNLYPDSFCADSCEYVGKAAYYHDIGKAWTPRKILLKPSKLNDDEIRTMQRHPLLAKELFQLIFKGYVTGIAPNIVCLAYDSAVYHHEWWNGKGYPFGLSRERIPLIARITSICDTYDAITSDRAYRHAHNHDFACREIEANAGIQFDPALARTFLDHAEQFQLLHLTWQNRIVHTESLTFL